MSQFLTAHPDDDVTFLPLEAVWPDRRLDASRLRPKREVDSGYTRFAEGDVLIPKITPTFEADRSTIATGLRNGFGCGTTELHVLRAGPGLNVRYANYVVSSREFLLAGAASMIGVAGQRRVPESFIEDFPIDLPGLSAQRAIADFLDAETARIDALIVMRRRQLALNDERVESQISQLTRAAATCATRARADTVEAGWERVQLHQCFRSIQYGIGEASRSEGKVAVLGMGNIGRRQVVGEANGFVDTVPPTLLLRLRDLLFNRTNSLDLVGKVALVRTIQRPTTVASYLVVLRTHKFASADFLNYLVNTPEFLGLACSSALPSIGQANLNPSRWGHMHVHLPPLAEQRAIVRQLDAAVVHQERLEMALVRQVEFLRERRQALITAAVTGEIDVSTASERGVPA